VDVDRQEGSVNEMKSSLFASAVDVWGEGAGRVVSNISQRAGATGVAMSVSYHDGRDIFPHNPKTALRFLEPGAVFFRSDESVYRDGPLRPVVSELVQSDFDPLNALIAAASDADIEVHAWTVYLHRDMGRGDEPWSIKTCFGEPLLTDLCPANPAARAYCVGLTRDVARYNIASIATESLHYAPLEHGYHHERYFLPLSSTTRFLMGLCFCQYCVGAAQTAGVDAEAVQRDAKVRIRAVFESGETEMAIDVDREEVENFADGQMAGYLAMRAQIVTSLAEEVTLAAGDVPVGFGDLSGVVKGYANGLPTGDLAADTSWKIGIDWDQLRGILRGVQALGYAYDPERVAAELQRYVEVAGDAYVTAVFRPSVPDCDSANNLRAKVAAARALGLDRTDFYHYGFAPLSALDLIAEALH